MITSFAKDPTRVVEKIRSMDKYLPESLKLARAFRYITDDECRTLGFVALRIGIGVTDPRFVNIGAGSGTSSLTMYEACPDAIITTIDISEEGPLGGLQNEINAFKIAKYETNVPKQILGNSQTIWREYPGLSNLDLIFIDGDHQEDGVRKDLTAWWERLRVGGFLIGHDYGRDVWPDVKMVFDEFIPIKKARVVIIADTMIVIKKVE